ncbi:MAG: NAD(P)H-dependent oxidoreductase [Deltaproteobacteria bacterium]|nr:NAD(P)H-dependent oxidoreductase [Deltaproteobacteria bacterium]
MKILVILAHPTSSSFNHAIAGAVCDALRGNGHNVIFHDLYAESFDPLLRKDEIPEKGTLPELISQHCEEFCLAEGIVIVHPNWWGQPPAILKGWIDRVFRPGVAYRFVEGDSGEGVPVGLLKARVVLILNTSNTPDMREHSVFGDPLDTLWKRCIFELCGVSNVHRRMFTVVVTSTPDERRKWLEEAGELVRRLFPVKVQNSKDN